MTRRFLSLFLGLSLSSTFAHAADSSRTLVVGAVGDVMMGSDYPSPRLPAHPEKLFQDAAAILQGVDVAFGNFEGTFGVGGQSTKTGPNSHSFRTPPEYADYLAAAGFDVMSLANNHAMDFGPNGIKQSKAALDGENIEYSARDGGIARLEVNGLKVALIAASTYGSVRNINEPGPIWKELKAEAETNDIVIVSVHAGAEGSDKTHVYGESESAFGENRGNVVKFAHAAVDRGADLILMHGPHVPRGMEVYKERLIAYSLGNFCTYGRFGLSGNLGLAPLLEVKMDEQGRFLAGFVHSFKQTPPGGPVADSKRKAAKLMQSLSLSDFPGSAPQFDADGGFTPSETIRLN